jgi:hypothetical protein
LSHTDPVSPTPFPLEKSRHRGGIRETGLEELVMRVVERIIRHADMLTQPRPKGSSKNNRFAVQSFWQLSTNRRIGW